MPAPAPMAANFSSPSTPPIGLMAAHTVFGEVIDGMDVVENIPVRDPATATEPGLKIIRIDIETK